MAPKAWQYFAKGLLPPICVFRGAPIFRGAPMLKLHLTLVLVGSLAGCAAIPTEPKASTAAQPLPLDPATEVVTVDITRFLDTEKRCENVTRGGSRIVIAQRCWSAGREVEDEEELAGQLEQVRRDQDELERRQRDIE